MSFVHPVTLFKLETEKNLGHLSRKLISKKSFKCSVENHRVIINFQIAEEEKKVLINLNDFEDFNVFPSFPYNSFALNQSKNNESISEILDQIIGQLKQDQMLNLYNIDGAKELVSLNEEMTSHERDLPIIEMSYSPSGTNIYVKQVIYVMADEVNANVVQMIPSSELYFVLKMSFSETFSYQAAKSGLKVSPAVMEMFPVLDSFQPPAMGDCLSEYIEEIRIAVKSNLEVCVDKWRERAKLVSSLLFASSKISSLKVVSDDHSLMSTSLLFSSAESFLTVGIKLDVNFPDTLPVFTLLVKNKDSRKETEYSLTREEFGIQLPINMDSMVKKILMKLTKMANKL